MRVPFPYRRFLSRVSWRSPSLTEGSSRSITLPYRGIISISCLWGSPSLTEGSLPQFNLQSRLFRHTQEKSYINKDTLLYNIDGSFLPLPKVPKGLPITFPYRRIISIRSPSLTEGSSRLSCLWGSPSLTEGSFPQFN